MEPDPAFADRDLAALYNTWHPPGERAEFAFYHPMIMAARSVLDVGCGTGAMLHRAREAGHAGRLCGLDPAAGMLAQARRGGDIEWVEGDLSSVMPYTVVHPLEANGVFLEKDEAALTRLRDAGWFAYRFIGGTVRFTRSWATAEPTVEEMAEALREIT